MEKALRKTGTEIIGDVPWGTHICQFYQTKEDLLDILVPYFKAGLENNEFCMWITSEPLKVEDAKAALNKVVKNLDHFIKKGQIEILDYSEWYTKSGKFDVNNVLQGWVEKENQALKRGYDGLRLSGNTFWLGKKDWRNFTDYEEEVNKVIAKYRMIAICSFSLDKCGASEVTDVVSNHQFALIRREGKWVIIESSERKCAEAALRVSHRFLEIANRHTSINPLLNEFVMEVQKITQCVAVGIRILDEEGNIPYQAYNGFSQRFYESESPLSVKSDQCMCINVIKGTTGSKLPFYTEGGSFYMNGTTRFLATVSEEEKGQTRNVCNQVGYESVALVPMRLGDCILGLIHVADPQENMVPLETVQILEWVAIQLGEAMQRVQAEEKIRQYNGHLEKMVKERTAELIKTTEQLQRELAERKRAEVQIQTSLKEKEVLMQEIHHRVKNNLQVISSLLNMYSKRIHDQQVVDLFTEVRNTIHSMALIHSEFYQSERFDQINMESYLQKLANSLVQTYKTKRKWITVNISPSDVYLSMNQVIPCALVLNELISNAFKHAFQEGQEGKIEVSIQRSADGIVFMRVKDDGIGFPEEIDIYRTDSLGLKLITNLVVDQLKGSIQMKREKGTEFIIEFKIMGGVKDG